MKSTGLAALALAIALPAWAQDAKPTEGRIDASFTWSLVDLASLPAGEGQSVSVSEVLLVITGNEPGPFDRLGGRCLFLSRVNGEAYRHRAPASWRTPTATRSSSGSRKPAARAMR